MHLLGFPNGAVRSSFPVRNDSSLIDTYPSPIGRIRKKEYPQLKGSQVLTPVRILLTVSLAATTYLDHAGATLYPRSLIETVSNDMINNTFGNPHSNSPSSILSSSRINSARMRLLHFFKADPEHFDLIFVANATAAIKLVVDCMIDYSDSLWYGYHNESHSSLVGSREVVTKSTCFASDDQVENWLNGSPPDNIMAEIEGMGLFAFPGQSNMTGRRLPLDWSRRLRCSPNRIHENIYSLLDAAALASTTQVDLSDEMLAPDFTAISMYKIFGYPDLGALIVRKASGHVLGRRRYFGGGTVDMIINGNGDTSANWSSLKDALHERLEDGTPPFHSIIALEWALKIHERIYGSMDCVSRHTCSLSKVLFDGMRVLRHQNGRPLCTIYCANTSTYGDPKRQGPTIAFNIMDPTGQWIGKSTVEKLAIANGIQLRTGGLCNPGGIAASLDLTPQEMRANFAEGLRCGNDVDILNGKPTGVVRVSLGAMSSIEDVHAFLAFLRLFVNRDKGSGRSTQTTTSNDSMRTASIKKPRLVTISKVHTIKQC